MSLDASYILVYDNPGYTGFTPMQQDVQFLKEKFDLEDHCFLFNNGDSIYWDKPKYTLTYDDIEQLHADQILERKDFELWRIVK